MTFDLSDFLLHLSPHLLRRTFVSEVRIVGGVPNLLFELAFYLVKVAFHFVLRALARTRLLIPAPSAAKSAPSGNWALSSFGAVRELPRVMLKKRDGRRSEVRELHKICEFLFHNLCNLGFNRPGPDGNSHRYGATTKRPRRYA